MQNVQVLVSISINFSLTLTLKIAISSRFVFFSTPQTFHVYNLNKWHDMCQKERSIILETENSTLFLHHLLTQTILLSKKVNINTNSRVLLFRVSNRNLSLFITRFKHIYQCQKMIVTLQKRHYFRYMFLVMPQK